MNKESAKAAIRELIGGMLDDMPSKPTVQCVESPESLDIRITDTVFELDIQIEGGDQPYDDILVSIELCQEGKESIEEVYSGSLGIDPLDETIKNLRRIIDHVFKHQAWVFKKKRVFGGVKYTYVIGDRTSNARKYGNIVFPTDTKELYKT